MDKKKIGERLRKLREERKLSISEVAEACNVTPSAICMYETGERIPKDEIKIELSKIYKKSVTAIFFAD